MAKLIPIDKHVGRAGGIVIVIKSKHNRITSFIIFKKFKDNLLKKYKY
jgi:hypothetical protein